MAEFNFKFPENWYTVQGADTIWNTGTSTDRSALKKEYTRMRDTAQKRLKRMEKEFPESRALQNRYRTVDKKTGELVEKLGFQELKNINPKDFTKAFTELKKFLSAKGSSVSGQKEIRQKTIRRWQEQGIDLNKKNYDMTMKIMGELRKRKMVYGSDKVLELADVMVSLSPHQINEWMNHLDILLEHTDTLTDIEGVAGYSFDEVVDILGE